MTETIRINRTTYTIDRSTARPAAHANGLEIVADLVTSTGQDGGSVIRVYPARRLMVTTGGGLPRTIDQATRARLVDQFGA